jgi:aryl-alcohol dehydrogenase-like predicted oxidoreductase
VLTGKYRAGKAQDRRDEAWAGAGFQPENSPQRTAVLDTLIAVADETGVTPGEIAIAWVAAKGSLPIIGPRTLAQLKANLAAAKVTLSAEQIARLDEVSAIPPVYPYTVLNERRIQDLITGDMVDRIDMPARPAA